MAWPIIQVEAKKKRKKRSWHYHARRLYGESDAIQRRSHRRLKNYPKLNDILQREIRGGKHRQLALDVVASLQKFKFVPLLIEVSRSDETGLSYLTINALINAKNRNQVAELYGIRLKKNKMSMAARVILIDTLGRLKEPIDKSLLEGWLEKGSYEEKSAVLNYLRRTQVTMLKADHQQMLRLALQQEPFQVRLQAIHNFSGEDLDLSLCEKDENPEVKAACKYRQQHPEVTW